jgi:excisionase family DNA binding protein
MIDLEGTISVAEAAKRLKRSTEQVRRYLREGKLKGQRIGNQWFVEEASLPSIEDGEPVFRPLIPKELAEEIRRTREAIFRRNGIVFDAVEMVRESREGH